MPGRRRVSVIETETFIRSSAGLLNEEERNGLVDYLASCPDAGVLISGSGGVRKLRWAARGKGKRGGARIIHYFADERFPVFLLFAYGKGEQENLSPADVADFKELSNRLLGGFSLARAKKVRV